MKTLEQKTRVKIFRYEIDDSGLTKKTFSKSGDSEYHLPFEKITTNKIVKNYENKSALYIGLLLLGISIFVLLIQFFKHPVEEFAYLFWLFLSVISLGYYFFTKRTELCLVTTENKALDFIGDNPSKEAVTSFFEQLIDQRNTILKLKYSQPTKHLEYAQQVDTLNWLLNMKVVTRAEYEGKILELNSLFSNSSGNEKIGFSLNEN